MTLKQLIQEEGLKVVVEYNEEYSLFYATVRDDEGHVNLGYAAKTPLLAMIGLVMFFEGRGKDERVVVMGEMAQR